MARLTYLVLNFALGPFLLFGGLGCRSGDGSFLGGHLRNGAYGVASTTNCQQRVTMTKVTRFNDAIAVAR